MSQIKTFLLIVDPQNDFCDPKGALFVPGANHDIVRLSAMIQNNRNKIDHIEVTLDSHHWIHIAHPYFWINANNEEPPLFTQISLEDVEGPTPKWKTRYSKYANYAINYIKKLTLDKKYTLTIWPPHCIIGTWGHNISQPLVDVLKYYEATFNTIHYTLKGSNPLTEHYSAIKAEIVNTGDPSTDINKELLEHISNSDRVIIGGEALSHCVANTIKDAIKHLGKGVCSKFIILEDACSSVHGFEDIGKEFLNEMKLLNVKICKSTDCFDK